MGPEFDVVVNIQGDEPLVDPDAVRAAVAMVERGFEVGTCATPIDGEEEFLDPAVVKVVRAADGSACYISQGRRYPSGVRILPGTATRKTRAACGMWAFTHTGERL